MTTPLLHGRFRIYQHAEDIRMSDSLGKPTRWYCFDTMEETEEKMKELRTEHTKDGV